jgi:hypothetical protein
LESWQITVSGVRTHCGAVNPDYEVNFREAIARAIPSLTKRLEDDEEDVRLAIVKIIGKLADHGEWQVESTAVQLTRITKSSFVKPS